MILRVSITYGSLIELAIFADLFVDLFVHLFGWLDPKSSGLTLLGHFYAQLLRTIVVIYQQKYWRTSNMSLIPWLLLNSKGLKSCFCHKYYITVMPSNKSVKPGSPISRARTQKKSQWHSPTSLPSICPQTATIFPRSLSSLLLLRLFWSSGMPRLSKPSPGLPCHWS